jgi:hypothetical protein
MSYCNYSIFAQLHQDQDLRGINRGTCLAMFHILSLHFNSGFPYHSKPQVNMANQPFKDKELI